MADSFDPYSQWLGIPPDEQPPDYYRLLGVERFEEDRRAIEEGAERQSRRVVTFRNTRHGKLCDEVLYKINVAKSCLLSPQLRSAYDAQLRRKLSVSSSPSPPQTSQPPTPETAGVQATEADASNPDLEKEPIESLGSSPAAQAAFDALDPLDLAPDGEELPTSWREDEREAKEDASPHEAPPSESVAPSSAPPKAEEDPLSQLLGGLSPGLLENLDEFDEEFEDAEPAPGLPELADLESDPAGLPASVATEEDGAETDVEPSAPRRPVEEPAPEADPVEALVPEDAGYVLLPPATDDKALPDDLGYEVVPRGEEIPFDEAGPAAAPAEEPAAPKRRLFPIVAGAALVAVLALAAWEYLPLRRTGTESAPAQGPRPLRKFTGLAPGSLRDLVPPELTRSSEKPKPKPAPPTALAEASLADLQKRIAETTSSAEGGGDEASRAACLRLAREILLRSDQWPELRDVHRGLLRKASELAARGGDVSLAFEAVDSLGGSFERDLLEGKVRVLKSCAPAAADTAQAEALLDACEGLFRWAMVRERFDLAAGLAETASAVADRHGDEAGSARASRWRAGVQSASLARQKAEKAEEQLREAADDAEAHLSVGLWRGLHQCDWQAALSHLAKGSDPRLAGLAEEDLRASAPDRPTMIQRGDAWWEAAADRTGSEKDALWSRAAWWYEQARLQDAPEGAPPRLALRLDDVARAGVPDCAAPSTLGNGWWKTGDRLQGEAQKACRLRAAFWYHQAWLETPDATLPPTASERIVAAGETEIPQPRTQHGPWLRQVGWPCVFEEAFRRPASVARFRCAIGQHAGHAAVEHDGGIRLAGAQSVTAIWLPVPSGERAALDFQFALTEDGDLCAWLGGPGRGNSIQCGYCVVLRRDGGELLREGEPAETFALSPPLEEDVFHAARLRRDEGRVRLWIDGTQTFVFEDEKPLAGELYGRAGLGAEGGSATTGVRLRNIALRRPFLPPAERQELGRLPRGAPWSAPQTANGEEVFSAGASELVSSGWFHSQPEFSVLVEDQLILCGPNAMPAVMRRGCLKGDFALEAVFEYVPPRLPKPPWDADRSYQENYLRCGADAENFRLVVGLAEQLPERERFLPYHVDLPAGWEVALPDGSGNVSLAWINGKERQVLAVNSHYPPVAGVRHVARLERRGRSIRVFLDGGLLVEGSQPEGASGRSGGPALVGLRQIFGGCVVHRVAVYRFGSDAPAEAEREASARSRSSATSSTGI